MALKEKTKSGIVENDQQGRNQKHEGTEESRKLARECN